MAMLPFCGYNISHYFTHWIRMRKQMTDCPRIFHVNWFRKDDQGRFLWPGFGENMRVLEWIVNRCHGRAYAAETILGWMPRPQRHRPGRPAPSARSSSRRCRPSTSKSIKREILTQEELFLKLAGELPKEMIFQRELLIARL